MSNGIFIPNGSYQQTVMNITVTLRCSAQKINQQWVPAELDLTQLTQANIANIDGVLKNVDQGVSPNGFVPGGSYTQTCRDIVVLLQCQARKIDQSYIPAALDLTKLPQTADIANMDGSLVDMAAVNAAHAQVAQMFPQYKGVLDNQGAAINHYAITGVAPQAAPPSPPAAPAASSGGSLDQIFTPCEMASGGFIIDCFFFALGLMGIRVSNNERITRVLLRELGQNTINGLRATVVNFSNATNVFTRAKYLFSIISGTLNLTMLKSVLSQVADQMSTWDWLKASVIATAQLTAWFASDGVAFVAEAVIVLASAVTLIQSANNAVKVCSA
jgi:hypothetical protein